MDKATLGVACCQLQTGSAGTGHSDVTLIWKMRFKVFSKARGGISPPARVFVQLFPSHCAPDGTGAAVPPPKLTVAQLRAALKLVGLDTLGAKPALVARLEAAQAAGSDEEPLPAQGDGEVADLLTPAAKVRQFPMRLKPLGSKSLQNVGGIRDLHPTDAKVAGCLPFTMTMPEE